MEKKVENTDEDYFLRPNNIRELILPEHFMPFFMSYLKDGMKNECIEIQLHPACAKFLDQKECKYDNLTTLTDEQLVEFKALFQQHRALSHQGTSKQMDFLLDCCVDILAKKVPTEGVNIKIDQIHNKIKLVPLPKDTFEADWTEERETQVEGGEPKKETIVHKKNLDFFATMFIRVAQHEEEFEVPVSITKKDG